MKKLSFKKNAWGGGLKRFWYQVLDKKGTILSQDQLDFDNGYVSEGKLEEYLNKIAEDYPTATKVRLIRFEIPVDEFNDLELYKEGVFKDVIENYYLKKQPYKDIDFSRYTWGNEVYDLNAVRHNKQQGENPSKQVGDGKHIEVGTILVSSWGYDQTNIDFYKVLKVTSSSCVIQKMIGKVVGSEVPYDRVVPVKLDPSEPPMTKRIQDNGNGEYVRIASYASAHIWSGNPERETNSLFGH